MRLFISINFDENTIDKIAAVQDRLAERGNGRFTSRDNLHLTLAFLGETDEDRVPELKQILGSLNMSEMELKFSHVGCFRRDSELWWIGISRNEKLERLQRELMDKLIEAGFSPDRKPFKPHITLAREMKIGRCESEELLAKPFGTAVGAVSLMLSHRPNGRLTYTELARATCAGECL